ncbi:CRTAC1 family protein [Aquisphaera insulae]|uniref:CRTAC1 family protein n=1 Tax=Aquisphaera insulae TaxID=2712864 RepID=UPI0013ED5E3C|nr:CRTAC1 family protein [Aquisphaera insulae]
MRRPLLITMVVAVLVLGTWLVVRAGEARRFRGELARVREDLDAHRYSTARSRLSRLASRRPADGELLLLLGECERQLGRPDDALAVWGRIPEGSPEGSKAALARGRLALARGCYRIAEPSLLVAMRSSGESGEEARRLLEVLYWTTGRRDAHRGMLRDRARREADPSGTLRELWIADRGPYPVDAIGANLAKARLSAPDDEMVWLASADLAIRTGRFDEAAAWLDRCERTRPEGLAVWKARLDLARAAGLPDEARRAAGHLPLTAVSRGEMLATRAWLAERSGDRESEVSTLEMMLNLVPADHAVLTRLADLDSQSGDRARAAELRRREAAVDAAVDEYKRLIDLPEMASHAVELGRIAESLGLWFEAKLWWTLAARRDPAVADEARSAIARMVAAEEASENVGEGLLVDHLGAGSSPGRGGSSVGPEPIIPRFEDQAASRGLDFRHDHGPSPEHQLPETMSGGVAVLDFDGDGWFDIYAVQGGPFPPREARPAFGDRLFRNLGQGRYRDVTAESGLASLPGGYGHGVAVGDYDNDGRPDLFVTRWRSYALYHNVGGGRFEDATARAGLSGDRGWPTSAAWGDFDNDGDLDLYVAHYLRWDSEHPTLCEYPGRTKPGVMYCGPLLFPAEADHLFRNDGGRFVDVTGESGIVDEDGRGLGVITADLDEDGKLDIFVTNDLSANHFFRNLGGFRFAPQAIEAGLAAGAEGGHLAGMGVGYGDMDGDGRLDVVVCNFFNESTTLYHNHGGGLFSDRSAATGLAAATRQVLGFGVSAFDANNDGRLDLVQANGHVADLRPVFPYAMRPQLLLGDDSGRFVDPTERAGPAWHGLLLGRGLATGDVDNDGRMDILVLGQGDPLALFHNSSNPAGGHHLSVALEGVASNRDGVGSIVTVTADGRTRTAARFGGGSYQSSGDPRLHFGLGTARRVDRVEIRWPSGKTDVHENLRPDAGYRFREGEAPPRALPLPEGAGSALP